MDGQTLSSAMHARGINIRYLGRIVHLLLEREIATKEASSKITEVGLTNGQPINGNGNGNGSSLLNMPHFMTTIAVMELISRSAKHVFNPYIQASEMLIVNRKLLLEVNCFNYKIY